MTLVELHREVLMHSKQLTSEESIVCELEVASSEAVVSANRAALLEIATRIIGLVALGNAGSHFTIDKADIAPDASGSLTISLL